MKYHGIEEIIKDQYAKGLLTVDFQAMLSMKSCPHCFGSRLKKESLHCFLCLDQEKLNTKQSVFFNKTCLPEQSEGNNLDSSASPQNDKTMLCSLFINQEGLPFARPADEQLLKVNIRDLQRMELNHLISFLELFKQASNKP